MNNYVLYLHTSPSGKRYYGITKQNPKQRWANGKGYQNNPYFTRAIEKYGWDNITHEILFDDLTEYEAQELEKYMIQWYDTANRKYGYNISTGGEGGNSGCERTEEWNQKISESMKGEKAYWFGKHHSEETKKKISENHADFSGENHPMYNKHHTEEWKQNHSEAMKGRYNGKNNPRAKSVICITTKRIFFTTKEGAEYYDIKNNTNISQCCKGKRKSAGKHNNQKLVWRYLNHNHNKIYRIAKNN